MTVTCDVCGDEFTPARSDARYCSGKCRTEAYRVRRDGEKPKSKRRPLTDAFFSTTFDLRRLVERLERLSEDDRLPRNRQALSASHYSDLQRQRDAIDRVMQTLGDPSRDDETVTTTEDERDAVEVARRAAYQRMKAQD